MKDQTYLAIVDGSVGYVLEIYPVERIRNRERYGDKIIGEFPDISAAKTALFAHMKVACERINLPHWWGPNNS